MSTPQDPERLARVREALKVANLDGIVCSLPRNVLMLTSYWPVIGTSVALVNAAGDTHLIVPEDEAALAEPCGIPLSTFQPGKLETLVIASEQLRSPLQSALQGLGLSGGRLGSDGGAASTPASYSATHLYGSALRDLLEGDSANVREASEMLNQLSASLTRFELDRLRRATSIIGEAFTAIKNAVRIGTSEAEIAAELTALLSTAASARNIDRAGGFAWCMSGANSAQAHYAFAYTRHRRIEHGDLVLLHCNSQAFGMWTDVTRTFVMGQPSSRQREIYRAVFEARDAAFAVLKPGATGAQVDQAARKVMARHGFAEAFKHGTGHGVGFGAISGGDRPRIHPQSPDVLAPGTVFNIEPAAYFEGFGGIRQCEMVVITDAGAELLTPFQDNVSELVIE
ncbi:MAG: Xaa-Pro peptidase family protein [Acidobacteriaceae bacterium]